MAQARHGRRLLPDVRPLDRFSSIKIKLGVLVTATVTLAAFVTWLGLRNELAPALLAHRDRVDFVEIIGEHFFDATPEGRRANRRVEILILN